MFAGVLVRETPTRETALDVDAPTVAPVLPVATGATRASERRVLLALDLSAFMATLIVIAPTPFFPSMADDLDVSIPLLCQVIAAMLLLSAVLGLVVGPLADRYGYHRVIVFGLGAAAGCLLIFGVAPSFPWLIVGSLIGGLADAALIGPVLAVAGTHFVGAAARRALGWTTAWLAGSAIIGVPLFAAIGDLAGWRTAFVIGGVTTAGIAWLAAKWLSHHAHQPATRLRPGVLLAAYRPLLGHVPTLRLYGCSVLRAICWYGMHTYVGPFLGEDLELSTRAIGVAYMLGGAGTSRAASWPMARRVACRRGPCSSVVTLPWWCCWGWHSRTTW